MTNNKQNEYTNKAIALFNDILASFDAKTGKINLSATRRLSRNGNITTKIDGDFAKSFIGSIATAINKANGHSKDKPLKADKMMSHAKMFDVVSKAKDIKDVFGLSFDGEKIQTKINGLNKNVCVSIGITENSFNFSNANLLRIIKSAVKCYTATTLDALPVKVRKAKVDKKGKGKGKTVPASVPAKSDVPAKLNWFSHLKANGKKPMEVKKGTAIYNKLHKSFVALQKAG